MKHAGLAPLCSRNRCNLDYATKQQHITDRCDFSPSAENVYMLLPFRWYIGQERLLLLKHMMMYILILVLRWC